LGAGQLLSVQSTQDGSTLRWSSVMIDEERVVGIILNEDENLEALEIHYMG